MQTPKNEKIICVIPAFQEALNIKEAVRSVRGQVDEVIVVDDGSEDDTGAIAKSAGALVLRHLVNRGQGAALETGRLAALRRGAGVIVHFDADNQFLADEIKEVVAPILSGRSEIVFGSRFLGKKSNIPPLKRFIFIPLAHLVNLVLAGHTLTDPQCGFRAISRDAAEKIIINQDGMAHCSEIIALAHSKKLKIEEVPVTVHYKDFGQKFSGGLKIIFDLIKARIFN